MSWVSQLLNGQLSPEEFVVKAAAEIKKDAGFFASLPFGKTIEGWAMSALGRVLATKLSPTMVDLILHEIRDALGLTTATAVPPTPPG